MEVVQYYIDAYGVQKRIFAAFAELLENAKDFGIEFKKNGDNIIEFSLFGYPIEIFFTIVIASIQPYPFGKVTISRHDGEEVEAFFSFYFDEHGNTLNEINRHFNTWNINNNTNLRRIIALIVSKYIKTFVEEPEKEE